jgi:putative transcriptional regulator
MAFAWFYPALLSLAALLSPATVSPTAPSPPELAPPQASLAGDLLIASPDIGDPRFRRTVILIVEQGAGGALGIVVNRPLAMVPLAGLLKAMGLSGAGVHATIRLFAGGPVDPSAGFVLYSPPDPRPGGIAIDGHVAMTENPQILLDIAHGTGPKRSLVAFGYAGWGPGQLAMELARGDWFTIPETARLVFDDPRDHVWDDAMAARTTPL